MRKSTELLKKMTKALNFCDAYIEDFELDLKWLSDENIGYTDYLWVLKKAGTELIPLRTALAKGCFDNNKAHMLTGREIRAFLIEVTDRKNGNVDGAMTGMRNLNKFLTDNEKTPSAITMKFILSDGKTEEATTDWNPDYHDILMNMIESAPEDIVSSYVTEVLY